MEGHGCSMPGRKHRAWLAVLPYGTSCSQASLRCAEQHIRLCRHYFATQIGADKGGALGNVRGHLCVLVQSKRTMSTCAAPDICRCAPGGGGHEV